MANYRKFLIRTVENENTLSEALSILFTMYLMKTSCQWCMVPQDFPLGNTVLYDYIIE